MDPTDSHSDQFMDVPAHLPVWVAAGQVLAQVESVAAQGDDLSIAKHTLILVFRLVGDFGLQSLLHELSQLLSSDAGGDIDKDVQQVPAVVRNPIRI